MNTVNALRIGVVMWCVAILIAMAQVGAADRSASRHMRSSTCAIEICRWHSSEKSDVGGLRRGQGIKVATTTVNAAGVRSIRNTRQRPTARTTR